MRITTAFFSPTGFALIADRLSVVPRVRLLFSTDMILGVPGECKRLREVLSMFEQRGVDANLNATVFNSRQPTK